MNICFKASRYTEQEVGSDYINVPLTKEEYYEFVSDLCNAQKIPFKEGDKGIFFEGCMPIEVMAERGAETLLFGPMRGDGLVNPHNNTEAFAIIQLRQDNVSGSMYNMVGFQTRLTYGEQDRIFKKIPGLKNMNILRHGSMHRNTFINSPSLLNSDMSLKENNKIFFAGQISGVEGYIESIAHGLFVAYSLLYNINNLESKVLKFDDSTILGALMQYIIKANAENFQPMKSNFGILRDLSLDDKKRYMKSKKRSEKKTAYSERSLDFIKNL
jgi:methylenetetrahydrofolate--tRNA-(uracil-5-)-methyltransferase